ncbi:fibroblast growth factor receptor 2-like [Xenia sp. Carnegie-2017]|uniref:fibroblast growth factor receptor 2-like n=1 Tax=Xenia sp. Carnegie-2017 TaxID=2897299 RepID=UPI001F04FB2C|nr:fibroblast growth factor receptor 2-like [Xenia sp. Carnegie-2017]
MVVGGISFFIILSLVVVVAVILYKRKKAYGGFYILTMPPLTDYIKKLDPHTPITKQTNKLPYDAEWEFPRNRLNFARELGSGAFGKVFLADAMGIVAFDPRGSTKRKSTRRRFGGPVRRNHYVNNNKTAKVAVKTLKEFFFSHPKIYNNTKYMLSFILASRLCIHRDLATRNILVTDNYVIKIADFGLARDVGKDSQYIKTSTGLLPVKWMAIEAIIQRLFTEKSDVWSFGIVLWELFTLGGTPYPDVLPTEVADLLARGHRMEPPHACPEEISTLMMKCWHADKDCRPTFSELVKILDKIIELHTSSEGGQGYLEVQGELMNDYLSPSEVKTPEMDPFQCNSPLPPVPSPADNESFALLPRDPNARRDKFRFDKGFRKKGRKDSEIEKMHNDRKPEMPKHSDVNFFPENSPNNHNDGKIIMKEKTIDEHFTEKDRGSSEEKEHHPYYANLHKSYV